MKRHCILQFHVKIWHRLVRNSSRVCFHCFPVCPRRAKRVVKMFKIPHHLCEDAPCPWKKKTPKVCFLRKISHYVRNRLLKINFHEFFVKSVHAQSGKVVKTTITVFTGKSTFFRQINVFTKKVTKELISRKFLSVIELKHCTVWKKCKIICESDLHYISRKTADKILCETDITNFFQVIQQQSTFCYYK